MKKNDDGSITFTISKSAHKKLMKEYKDQVRAGLSEAPDIFPSVAQVDVNNAMDRITLTVDRETYQNSFDSLAAVSAYI